MAKPDVVRLYEDSPNKDKVGTITWDQCKSIAEEKGEELTGGDIDAKARIIAGTARSMGVIVEGTPA